MATSKLITRLKPTIEPDKLQFKAYGEGSGENNTTRDLGVEFPLVIINGYRFSQDDINSFEISMEGMLPTISVTIVDSKGYFTADSFPRDGDVINIRLASRAKTTYKDIRADFDIDGVSGPIQNAITQSSGATKYTFTGTMKVPGLFAEGCKAYGVGNTIQHLESIATDLKLGLATNVDVTEDSMNLITAYEPLADTLSGLVKHSYISDAAFQTFSIDAYYNINYVDINAMLNSDKTFEEALGAMDFDFNDIVHEDSKEATNEQPSTLILSSHNRLEGTNMHIERFSIKNESGRKVKRNGYKRILQYFENDSEEGLVTFNVEPLTSDSMKDIEEPLRGRRDEDRYLSEVKYKYVGRRMGDPETSNTHLNYNFAAIHNTQNLEEIGKMTLEVELSSWNPAIYRWQRIPVAIFNQSQSRVAMDTNIKDAKKDLGMEHGPTADLEDDLSDKTSIDDFLSGFYVVGSIRYSYKKKDGKIKQHMTLLRREWPARINNLG